MSGGNTPTPLNDSERVYRKLRRDIIEGRNPPGARLVEQRVANGMDVSRTPVREALRRLETEGLLVVIPNRGAQVRSFTDTDIADLYEARSRLEGYAAELAARRGTAAGAQILRETAQTFEGLAQTAAAANTSGRVQHVRALTAANARFHDTLLELGRADQVRRLLSGAVDLPLVFRALDAFTDHELSRSALFHHLITDAVEAGEPERAGRLMTEHVLQGRDALLLAVNDRAATGTER